MARAVPSGRGERLILLHAIDKNQGFLPGCQLLFKSISTDGRDYHTEMNGVIFEDWLKNKLLPVLPEPSLIIMDNAPYHKRQDEDTKAPTMANKHSEIQKWLNERNIPFAKSGPDSHKKALVNLVKAHKPPQQFTSEQLILFIVLVLLVLLFVVLALVLVLVVLALVLVLVVNVVVIVNVVADHIVFSYDQQKFI